MKKYEGFEGLNVVLRDGILEVAFSNPGRKNAMTSSMKEGFEKVIEAFDDDSDVRVLVITGEGQDFCAGADMGGLKSRHEEARGPRTRGVRRVFWGMMDSEKPIISKVRGVAYGLGVNIALGADIVVAAQGARFCDSHVKAGIAPGDGGAALFPLLLGFHRAKELLMLGDPILAEDAARLGMINHCVPDAELDRVTWDLAVRLRDSAPLAVAYAKMSVNTMLKQMMAGAFETSLAYDMLTLTTQDHKEGVSAFMEKRKPAFRGN